jgi:hypothetical protein
MTTDTDYSLAKSVLQKAVRRGNVDALGKASAFIQHQPGGPGWLTSRARLIAIEESWPMAGNLYHGEAGLEHPSPLLACTLHSKQKDAAGLGGFAQALINGDKGILDLPANGDIKLVAQGIERPDDFWPWVKKVTPAERRPVVNVSYLVFKRSIHPGDRAMAIAAAYLASAGPLPVLREIGPSSEPFPYWVCADKHTALGAQVIDEIRSSMGMTYVSLSNLIFLVEGSEVNVMEDSPWWGRWIRYAIQQRCQTSERRAVEIMESIKPLFKQLVGHRVESSLRLDSGDRAGFQLGLFG